MVVGGGIVMKKFLLNGSLLSAIFSVFGLAQSDRFWQTRLETSTSCGFPGS